ncbi:TetR/AcrR family transcriptional regulator [Dactylosporangium sp. NPDC049140]|uniref:TetR/AcrR family transcriptional regulator n=1 Tax=Dactylosporangium sp. NPDC049140 TaxID=3155647 RepID=UPI0033D1217B
MPTRVPRASSTQRGARTRAEILRAAVPLFVQNGYRGAPLAAVADAAQMTQPGVLHHFPSKEHLLMAVLEERDRESREAMREALREGGVAALHALEELVEHNADTPELVQLFTVLVGEAVAAEHPAHGFFVERYEHIRHRIAHAVRHGQETGAFRSDADAETIAAMVIAMMDGLQVQWLLDRQLDMAGSFRRFVEILRQYLGDQRPAS